MARPMPLAFSDAEFARRLRDLRTRMRAKPVDVLLVVAAENITYLTGYETIGYSNFGVLAVRQEGEPLLFIREMERTVAERRPGSGTSRSSRTTRIHSSRR